MNISKIILQFQKRHPWLDFEDLASAGNQAFAYALNTYDPCKSQLSTWVRGKVWYALQQECRKKARERKRRRKLLDIPIDNSNTDNTLLFMGELSGDARTLVELLIDLPCDVRILITSTPTPWNIKRAVRELLIDCGWTRARWLRAFQTARTIWVNQQH